METLKTNRLLLRPLGEGDIQTMHDLCVHPDVRRYLFKDQVLPQAQVENMIATSAAGFAARGIGFFALIINEQDHPKFGAFAGFCGIRPFADDASLELLFGVDPVLWGRGFGAEAARCVLQEAFENCGLDQVIAATDTPNQRSVRVLQKLGMSFRERREWHGLDTMFYELTAAEYACL